MDEAETSEGTKEERSVLDVHPPHEAAHSWRDILIHLATITVGLFIALSLEGCVEWQHHRHLVREARENIRSEIEDNQKSIRDAINSIHNEQKQIADNLATFAALEKEPKRHGSMSLNFNVSSTTLEHASWDTARETGALSFMPYAEVKSYAELADTQQEFARHTERLVDTYTPAVAYLYRFKGAHFSGDEASRSVKTAPTKDDDATPVEIAKTVPEGRSLALNIQSELLFCENIAQELDRQYGKALSQLPH